MIKFKARRAGLDGPLIVFGLSKRNIEKLQEGSPIVIDMAELGLTGEVFIFAGDTEESMMKDLEDHGYLPANKAHGTPN